MNSLKNSLKVVYFAIWPDHIFEYIFAIRISMIGLRRYIQNRKDTIQIPLCRLGPGFECNFITRLLVIYGLSKYQTQQSTSSG